MSDIYQQMLKDARNSKGSGLGLAIKQKIAAPWSFGRTELGRESERLKGSEERQG